jgi:hypothetical protein
LTSTTIGYLIPEFTDEMIKGLEKCKTAIVLHHIESTLASYSSEKNSLKESHHCLFQSTQLKFS